MKIVCVENNLFNLPKDNFERIKEDIYYSDGLIGDLVVNQEYLVYGLVFRENCLWFQLCPDLDDTDPTPYPSELFNVLDPRLSKYWVVNSQNNGNSEFFVSSDSIVNEAGYLERLIDGDAEAVEKFYQFRLLVESEAGG